MRKLLTETKFYKIKLKHHNYNIANSTCKIFLKSESKKTKRNSNNKICNSRKSFKIIHFGYAVQQNYDFAHIWHFRHTKVYNLTKRQICRANTGRQKCAADRPFRPTDSPTVSEGTFDETGRLTGRHMYEYLTSIIITKLLLIALLLMYCWCCIPIWNYCTKWSSHFE